MKKRSLFAIVFTLLIGLVLVAAIVSAETVTLQPDETSAKDTYIQQDDPTRVRGTQDRINLALNWLNSAKRGILQFDLSSIPAGAIIDNAELKIYMYNDGTGADVNITAHRVTRSWVEGTNGYTDDGATWNTYDGTNTWTSSGGDFDSTIEAENITSSENQWYVWVITDLVAEWHNGTQDNYGVLLKGADETGDVNRMKQFRSSSHSTAGERPQLVVDYTTDVAAPNVTGLIPTAGAEFNFSDVIEIGASVVDDGTVGAVFATIDFPNGTSQQLDLTNSAGDVYNDTFTVPVLIGQYNISITANDTSGNVNSSETTYFDVNDYVFPNIDITYPEDLLYDAGIVELNYTVSDDYALGSCWYSLDGGANTTFTCTDETITGLTSNEGSNTWTIYVNDTSGNENTSSVTFEVDTLSPVLDLVLPSDGSTLGTNLSIPLNFTVSDANLGSCWYNVDGGENVNLTGCANTTFNVSGDGTFVVNVFANDTFAREVQDSASFTVSIGAPAISLTSPVGVYLNYSENITFVFTATDVDLDRCELWGDFTGIFALNQSNSSVVSGVESGFVLDLPDGDYNWTVFCNDTFNNWAYASNKSFSVDTVNPTLSLTEPTGTKTSRTGIALDFSVSDSSPVNCIYNVYQGASVAVANTSVDCVSGTDSFGVASDGDFVLNFFVNDSAGNSNFVSSSFSVDTTPAGNGGSPGGGGGGGGGGGTTLPPSKDETRIVDVTLTVPDLSIKRGTSETIQINAGSKERYFLNKCHLVFSGEGSDWLSSEQEEGLSPGEEYNFDVLVNVPEDAEPKNYPTQVSLQCDEGKADFSFSFAVYRNIFDAEILDYERDGNLLKVNYLLKENGGEERELLMDFEMLDFDGIPRFKGQKAVSLGAREERQEVLEFDLPKDSFGEFNFVLTLSDGIVSVSTEKEIFLPSERGLTGLIISEENKRVLSIVGVIVLVLIVAFVVYWLIRKFKKKTKKIGRKKKRVLWDIEL